MRPRSSSFFVVGRGVPRSIYTRIKGVVRDENSSVFLSFSVSLHLLEETNNPLAYTGCIFYILSLCGTIGDDDVPKSEGRTKNKQKEREAQRKRRERADTLFALPLLVLRSRPPAGCCRLLHGETRWESCYALRVSLPTSWTISRCADLRFRMVSHDDNARKRCR